MLVNSFTVAIYIRLSKDDDTVTNAIENVQQNNCIKKHSNSIKNQRLLIQDYIELHEELNRYKRIEYCDDGFSGTNFDRPGIKKLLKDAKEKKINCIIVKDFSRFGRDYLEVGNYLDQIFPFIGIRFISINDHFDSKQNVGYTVSIEVSAKNIIYDYYSKDLSQKVKSVLKVKKEKGQYLGGYVPYGYRRSQMNKGKLIIDEEAANTVRKIFQMTKDHYSRSEIARVLNEEQIPTPAEHIMKYKERKTLWQPTADRFYWTMDAIIRILRNEIYLGKLVSGKYGMKEVGGKQTMIHPKAEWYTIEDSHEAIISIELFEVAKESFQYCNRSVQINKSKNINLSNGNDSNLLNGKLICGYCNYPMNLIKGKKPYYKCISNRFITNALCSNEHAVKRDLVNIIVMVIKLLEHLFPNNSDLTFAFTQKLNHRIVKLDDKLKNMRDDIKRINQQEIKQYEKYKNGLFTKDEYAQRKEQKIAQKKEIVKQIDQIESKKQYQINQGTNVIEDTIAILTNEFLCSMIETIFFYDTNHFEIVCKFKDEYSLPNLF